MESVMSNLVELFQEAVMKEDIHEIKGILSEIMKLSDDLGTSEHGRHNFAEKIGHHLLPELASIQNQHGLTAIHILSECGDVEMVRFLGNLNTKSQASEVLIDETRIDIQEHLNSQTALLQVCNADSDDIVSIETAGSVLPWAASRQETASQKVRNFIRLPIESRNVLLMAVGTIATLFFTVTTNLPAPFFKEDYRTDTLLRATDLIIGGFPTVIYLMIFNSTGFMAAMTAIIVLVWPLHFRAIVLLLSMCMCVVYIIMVSQIVPKFSVRFGKFCFSSIILVWFIVLVLLFFGVFILSLLKYTSSLCRFNHGLWKKIINYSRRRLRYTTT